MPLVSMHFEIANTGRVSVGITHWEGEAFLATLGIEPTTVQLQGGHAKHLTKSPELVVHLKVALGYDSSPVGGYDTPPQTTQVQILVLT